MSWLVLKTFDGKSLKNINILTGEEKNNLDYSELKADSTGIVNLAKLQGISKGKDTVFAKIIINSEKNQIKKLDFGFSDRVKVFVNDKAVYEGADNYRTRDYRFLGTVGLYDSIYLDLQKGQNEVVFAITENYKNRGGWAVQARFENFEIK